MAGLEGRAGAGASGPSLVPHGTAEGKAGAVHLNSPARPLIVQLWDSEEACSEPGRLSSLCSLKKKRKKEDKFLSFSDRCPIACSGGLDLSDPLSGAKLQDQYFSHSKGQGHCSAPL